MARKMSRVSTQNGIARPLINRKKNAAFANKLTTSSNNRKFLKIRERRKISQPKCKRKRSANGNVPSSNGKGNSVSSNMARARENDCVSVAAGRIENNISRDFNSGASNDVEMIRKKESVCASDNDAVLDTGERISVSLSTPTTTTTSNDFPKSWTAKMIRYYFKPNDKCKNFDYVKIMDKIEYKASDWWISDADRTECRRRRDFFQRCARCNQKGHTKKECKKLVVCYVCGEFSHRYPDCPNALCFTCGRATKKYTNTCRQCRKMLNCRRMCTLCGQVWHEENLCPSKWRKYLTVSQAQSSRESTLRLNSKKCCYNCAQRGHFGFECPLVSQSDYPPENPLKTAFPFGLRYADVGNDIDNHCSVNDSAAVVHSNGERCHENSIHVADVDPSHVHVIFLARQTSDLLSSEVGRRFLTNLSRNNNTRVELFCGKRSYLKVFGDDRVVDYCRTELVKWKTS